MSSLAKGLDVKIDQNTGEFIVGQQRLGAALGEADFLNGEIGAGSSKLKRSGTRNYYEAWRHVTLELDLGLTLGFLPGGSLQRISAQFVGPEIRGTEWSKEKEDKIKSFHDRWLKEQLGNPPYQFDWGRVLSILEPHWYSANIVIDYTQR